MWQADIGNKWALSSMTTWAFDVSALPHHIMVLLSVRQASCTSAMSSTAEKGPMWQRAYSPRSIRYCKQRNILQSAISTSYVHGARSVAHIGTFKGDELTAHAHTSGYSIKIRINNLFDDPDASPRKQPRSTATPVVSATPAVPQLPPTGRRRARTCPTPPGKPGMHRIGRSSRQLGSFTNQKRVMCNGGPLEHQCYAQAQFEWTLSCAKEKQGRAAPQHHPTTPDENAVCATFW